MLYMSQNAAYLAFLPHIKKKRVARDFAQIAHTKKEPGGSRCQVSQAAGFLSFRRFLSSPSGGAGVMVMLCGMLCGNTCGCSADVPRAWVKRGDSAA